MLTTLRTTGGVRRSVRTGMPSAKQSKGIGGSEWEETFFHYREMSKARAWTMKAAKDREEEFYDLARKDILGKTRLELWEEHLKDPIRALDKDLKCPENRC